MFPSKKDKAAAAAAAAAAASVEADDTELADVFEAGLQALEDNNVDINSQAHINSGSNLSDDAPAHL
jgi:hypothetical protein